MNWYTLSSRKVNSSVTRKEINMHLKFPQILFDTMAKEAHDKGTSVAALIVNLLMQHYKLTK